MCESGLSQAALPPLKEVGICILNYLENWLILAHSQGNGPRQRSLIGTLGQLGIAQTLPCAEYLFARCGPRHASWRIVLSQR